jgi:hypothetical protein
VLTELINLPCSGLTSGVSKVNRHFKASIMVRGESLTLGRFEDEEVAALAYDQAVR